MSFFIATQTTYTELQLTIMSGQKSLGVASCDKQLVSRDFLSLFSNLLKQTDCCITDLIFIAVNQGPGPFSSLRSVLAAVNGLSFATGVPLIGVSGLDIGIETYARPECAINVYLLNAFNRDVYFAVLHDQEKKTGYTKIDQLLSDLCSVPNTPSLYFYGNGSILFEADIKRAFQDRATIARETPDMPHVEHIGAAGYTMWQKGERGSSQLLPLYLKYAVTF